MKLFVLVALWALPEKLRWKMREKENLALVPEAEKWNQEEEKLRNTRPDSESAREKIDRLVPGHELKRIIL